MVFSPPHPPNLVNHCFVRDNYVFFKYDLIANHSLHLMILRILNELFIDLDNIWSDYAEIWESFIETSYSMYSTHTHTLMHNFLLFVLVAIALFCTIPSLKCYVSRQTA